MTKPLGAARTTPALCLCLALLVLATISATLATPARAAGTGGISAHASSEEFEGPTTPTAPAAKALLVEGRAIPPLDAPASVKRVIAAANRIRTKPYIWGGGHARWWDRGYDCSGAVSFALHGGSFLASPLPSGPLESWGAPGRGRWITVYANAGHAYAVIAGLRWDTAGNTRGTGPRWHRDIRAAGGGRFIARHPAGY